MEAKVAADTLKKVVVPVEATAFANNVLPVPGGPNNRTPFHALRFPTKISGIAKGNNTAYYKIYFAFVSYAMSSKVMFGLWSIIYL